jgi:hypothetical protein
MCSKNSFYTNLTHLIQFKYFQNGCQAFPGIIFGLSKQYTAIVNPVLHHVLILLCLYCIINIYSFNYHRCITVHVRQFRSVANYPEDYALCYGSVFLLESCTECDEKTPRLDLLAGKRLRSKAARKRQCWQCAYLTV